jgi:hypothetical protein
MKIKALITTLVLGSSSIAMAHPVSAPVPAPVIRDHRAPAVGSDDCGPAVQPMPPQPAPVYQPVWQPMPPQPAPVYQPPVYQPPVYQPHYHTSWTVLGGVNRIVDGAMSFRVGRTGQQFSRLKLESEGGKSLIQRVLIQFANGRTQTIEVNQYLTASNPTIKLDLEGRTRAIAKVTVIGRNARSSAYRVLAG